MVYESRCCEGFPYGATRYAYNFDLHEQARSKRWIEIDLSIQARLSTFQYPQSMGVAAGCCRKNEKTMQILTISEKKKVAVSCSFFTYVRRRKTLSSRTIGASLDLFPRHYFVEQWSWCKSKSEWATSRSTHFRFISQKSWESFTCCEGLELYEAEQKSPPWNNFLGYFSMLSDQWLSIHSWSNNKLRPDRRAFPRSIRFQGTGIN